MNITLTFIIPFLIGSIITYISFKIINYKTLKDIEIKKRQAEWLVQDAHQADEKVSKREIELVKKIKEFEQQKNDYTIQIQLLENKKENINSEIQNLQKLSEEAAKAFYDTNIELAQNNLEQSLEEMAINYQKAQEEYQKEYLETNAECVKDFNDLMAQKRSELNEIQKELDKITATYKASIEARLREQEIAEKIEYYKIKISETDLIDINILEKMKTQLTNPRILSMLIWSTYFQKPLKTLCNNILGTEVVCGIYKITNQITGECYVGQSKDIAKRWSDHAKCGLNIDRPVGNKLYQSMVSDGLQNFTWELLETCKPEELNEKERKYIEIYHSAEFGFNSTQGNK